MSKRSKYCLGTVLLIVLFASGWFVFKLNYIKNLSYDDLINISKLSDEFIDDYYEGLSNSESDEEKENMLIVISDTNIKNSYGAINVIEAPNNQYILKYDSEEDKNKALSKFNNDESIVSAEENDFYTIKEITYNSWGVESMALDYAVTTLNGDELKDVTVAIIDTGLDVELANKYYSGKIAETYNVLEESTTIMTDENGHGTHVFGTIAESTPSNVKILPIKVSADGKMYYTDIIAAINYVTFYEKADVINMSFGGYGYNQALEQAIEAAKEKNIISVAAAGNNNTSANHYPSALDNTISIASVDSSLNKSTFSNFGSKIDFTAPGTNIKSIMSSEASISKNNGNTDGDNDHETISGTSMATPHAVSAVAILKSFNKDLTLDNTVELLQSRTVDLGEPGWDKYYGYGLISFENAKFCDGTGCEKYAVFKESSEIAPTSIEVKYALRTTYNYGTINNLNPSQVRIYDSTGHYTNSTLGDLNGVEIIGYDAYDTNEQVITVRWQGLETTFNFTNPSEWESGWTYKVIENNDIIITGFTDFNFPTVPAKKLYIPENIDGYNVVAIGNEDSNIGIFGDAFTNSYEEIILPSSLTEIKGKYTFSGFDYVKKITALSNSLKITGNYIFADNTRLVEVVGTIEALGAYTFEGDSSLQKVTLSDNITELPNGAFSYCTNLESINIPSKVVSIGNMVFDNNFKLNNITLPEGLKTIGDYAFSYTNIENVTLPNSLEQIGENAFANSNIKNLSISKNLTSIGKNAFVGCSSLESIIVDEENPIYDSRENSNALIETGTNTILKGIASTIIPDTVTSIGSNAFSYDLRLERVEIPDNITEISSYAFYRCDYLTNIKIPRSVQIIGDYALENYPAERQELGYEQISLTILTYTDAYARTYAVTNEINYESMDPSTVLVGVSKRNYKSFDKVNLSNDITSVYLQYDVGKTVDSSYRESKIHKDVSEEFNIKYINNNDSFRYGDTYYIVNGTNEYGEYFEKQVTVTIAKATPEYTIPINLAADVGQKLSEIALPSGFEWMNSDEVIERSGNVAFKAKYIPEDTENYETVENIEIIVSVNNYKEIIEPNIVINDKTYDGTAEISIDNIIISNLDASEYSIESVISSSTDVGDKTATIKLKLTDEKYKNYTFADGVQEKEFIVDFRIVPYKLEKPSLKILEYIYNEEEQFVELNNYQEDKMNISGNTRTNAGEQDVTISLKSNNYVWSDGTSIDVILKFKIEKATPEYTIPINLTADVGQKLSEIALPSGFEWMNSNETIEKVGEIAFKAKYVPTDTKNYEIVENIDITVNVNSSKTIVIPNITLKSITYNGTTTIPTSSIIVSNLETSEYSVVSAVSSSADAGERIATIKLRLSDDKYVDYSFDNGKQEKDFIVDFEILKANINVDDYSEDVIVKYDGLSHSIKMKLECDLNITIKYMDENNEYILDEIPKYTEVGTYVTKYKVYINDNYTEYFGQKVLTIEDTTAYVINNYSVDEINKYISKIMVNTEVNTFTSNISLGYGYSINVDNKTINNRNILFTGGKTKIFKGQSLYTEFTNIVIGDINGDGAINSADLLKIRQHLLSTNILTGAYFLSSDVNYDDIINSADLLRVRQHLLGTKPIE